MKKSGLCSVSFRNLSYQEIIKYALEANIKAIEWGSDVHAKETNLEQVKRIKEACLKNNLACESYGTYFRLEDAQKFIPFIEAAKTLNAKVIRIWSGIKSSREVTLNEYNSLVMIARECGKMALNYGLEIAFEYHVNTLTDNPYTTKKFLEDINLENVKTYWQPMYWSKNTVDENLESLKILKDKIVNIHVYTWDINRNRYPMSKGFNEWKEYIKILDDGNFYLEFFKDDKVEQFIDDAKTLNELLRG